MADERPVVNVTPGTPIRSQTERDAEHIRLNRGTDDADLPLIERDPSDPRPEEFAGIEMSAEEKAGRERIVAFFNLPPDEQKAKIAITLDRGVVNDRLKVALPPDLHGEWARNEPMEIARMRTLGFWVDDTYATRRALHSDGTSSNIVGDVIHMVTTRQNREMIEQVRMEMQTRSYRNPKKSIEESDEAERGLPRPDRDIPTFSESNQRTVTASDVKAALSAADGQTRKQR